MAMLPLRKVVQTATFVVSALIGAGLIVPAPIAVAGLAPAPRTSFLNVNDPNQDPDPLVQDPPEVQGPSNPGQKTLGPTHRRSRHRAPTST
jgi:hypothetical protein